MIVNQWVPAAHGADAVGDYTRALRDLFRSWGWSSEIYAMEIDGDLEGDVRPWTVDAARAGDVTLLHFAMASPMTEGFAQLKGRRVLVYHNVTPARFFAPFDANLARLAASGRAELAALRDRVDLAAGVSGYNRRELESLGFRRTAVAPLLIDSMRLRQVERVPALEAVLDDGLTNILFVGRIAPNKKIEDHIRLAEHYKRYVDVAYRFIFVGRTDAVPAYYRMIRALIAEYRMLPERFLFPGAVPDNELAAYYRHAHAYVSLSEHEGFCVPLVEAMSMEVPVLAYSSTAVPETLDGAGIEFRPKDLEQASEWLGALVYDDAVRQPVLDGQRRRVRDFDRRRIEPELRQMVEAVAS